MLIYTDCIDELIGLQYTCDPCNETEGGRVRSLCLIKKGTTLPNPLTKADINLLIWQNKLWVMAQTTGTFDGGTPKMVTGYGDKKERQIGADYVLQVKDPIYIDNYAFWQSVENIEDWNIAWRTETQLAVVDSDVAITVKDPTEEGLDTEIVWNIEAKWYSKSKPELIAYPAGLFDSLDDGFEVLTGFSIQEGANVYVSVDADKACKVILSNGSILTSTAGVISGATLIAGEVIILVQKGTNLLDFDTSDFTGTLNFVVSDKNEILFTTCQLTTAMCDAILDVLIANGTVTGTHTIDLTDNIAAPTPSKIVSVEALGWQLANNIPEVGDLYGGGRIVFVDEALMIIAALQPMAFTAMYNSDVNYATLESDLISYNAIAHEGYSDWVIPSQEEALAAVENVVERLIVEGLDETYAHQLSWWTSEISGSGAHFVVNWNGTTATNAGETEDIENANAFLIRIQGV